MSFGSAPRIPGNFASEDAVRELSWPFESRCITVTCEGDNFGRLDIRMPHTYFIVSFRFEQACGKGFTESLRTQVAYALARVSATADKL